MLLSIVIVLLVSSTVPATDYVNTKHTKPWKVRFYPKKSLFRKADLIDRGCSVFIKDCPSSYKQYQVCARHYDGQYKTFNNYCELELENCNSWRRNTDSGSEFHKVKVNYLI